jgi:threonine aldolase
MIDLRSDTVTLPTQEMLDAMVSAPLGDDVYGADPTVNALEEFAADKLGFGAAIFAPSGTQSNLLAIMSHCQRGDEYIVGHDAHTFKYEAGGAAVLASVQPQTVSFTEQGELPISAIEAVIKPKDVHFASTKMLALENTYHGKVLPMDYLPKAREVADKHNLALHLDGARVFHAATYHNIEVTDITKHCDSVSVCLSKGLSAPVGSLLCGTAEVIERARKWRKMLGGGMRQAGVLAAAGRIALEAMPNRLQQDHDNAALLGQLIADLPGLAVRHNWLQTNMVWCDFNKSIAQELTQFAQSRGIIIRPSDKEMRLVIHRHIGEAEVKQTAAMLSEFFK